MTYRTCILLLLIIFGCTYVNCKCTEDDYSKSSTYKNYHFDDSLLRYRHLNPHDANENEKRFITTMHELEADSLLCGALANDQGIVLYIFFNEDSVIYNVELVLTNWRLDSPINNAIISFFDKNMSVFIEKYMVLYDSEFILLQQDWGNMSILHSTSQRKYHKSELKPAEYIDSVLCMSHKQLSIITKIRTYCSNPFKQRLSYRGSVRADVTEWDGTAERSDYYPYGMQMQVPWSDMWAQPYKFMGKEPDRENGWDSYDVQARWLTSSIAQWTTPDPLADAAPWLSPYSYCGGDPVNFVDNDGMRFTETSWDFLNRYISDIDKRQENNNAEIEKQRNRLSNDNLKVKDVSKINNSYL